MGLRGNVEGNPIKEYKRETKESLKNDPNFRE